MCLEVPRSGAFWTPVSVALSTPSRACEGSFLRLVPGFPDSPQARTFDFVRKGSLVASSIKMGAPSS
jgi:hypothetical protein